MSDDERLLIIATLAQALIKRSKGMHLGEMLHWSESILYVASYPSQLIELNINQIMNDVISAKEALED